MPTSERWLLPEGIEELLPPEAQALEALRRRLLDRLQTCGYELVMPPFVEYLESLLTGTGHDLDLQTFKVIDPLTGRQMGIRADMTPQAARIDAHQLKRDVPVRLCYLGTVLHTRPGSLGGTRAPLQIGAELYGHAGLDSDLEVLELMLDMLSLTGLKDVYVDLGHVGIFRALAQQAGLTEDDEQRLFDALQRKANPEIAQILNQAGLADSHKGPLAALAGLNGDSRVLAQAREVLAGSGTAVQQALDELITLAERLSVRRPDIALHFDLAELRGYHYQNGVVFAAFVAGHGQEVARGGRYDGIGKVFGRARPATGFSADIKQMVALSTDLKLPSVSRIFAPAGDDAQLLDTIEALRARGEIVVRELPGQSGQAGDMGCDRQLQQHDGQWQVKPV